jgi:hypothetical protein
VRQRGVVRELGGEDFFEGLALRGDRSEAVFDPLLVGGVALAGFLGDGGDDRLVEGLDFGGEVLILANQLRQPIAAGRKAPPSVLTAAAAAVCEARCTTLSASSRAWAAEISSFSCAPNSTGTAMDALACADAIVFCTSGNASA